MDYKIKKYTECPLKYENGQAFINYINENRHLLKNKPQTYQHSDYHIGNMMIGRDGKLYIIDFNRNDYGDTWAIPFGEGKIETMCNQAKEVLSWYDNMKNPIPTWYFKGYYLQYIDGIPFKLKSAFDFSFLNEYDRVFKVFDDQDSGNISFGTEKDGQC